MPLHRLEASQLLHARGAPLVADPHAEGALHQHASQLTDVALPTVGRVSSFTLPELLSDTRKRRPATPNLVSRDGYLMHGVIDGFQEIQHRCQRPLELRGPLAVCAIFEKLLKTQTDRQTDTGAGPGPLFCVCDVTLRP